MRKVWIWLLVMFLGSAGGIWAANLEQTTIRLNRTATAVSPLPILVLVTTNSVTVEDDLRITVGNGWSVGSSVNVSVSDLPNGVTPLPSINDGVSTGQIIDFPIGDLAAGTKYGFYITSGIGINPSPGDHTWVVATNADSMKVNVPTVNSDQVAITGKVGANASDFQLEMTADKTGNLSVDEEVTYQITYGSYLATMVKPLVITAEWSRGTVTGSPIPSVDIADYVVGSGTTARGGVEPVVDLVNRKITWTITSFPANTVNQTVEFKLVVNDSYSGTSDVSFTVTAGLNGANVVSITSAVDNVYHPAQPTVIPTPIPSSTPTPVPTSTSTSTTTTTTTTSTSPTATPTPAAVKIKIEKIGIATLSSESISVETSVNVVPLSIKIIYGTTMKGLNSSVTNLNGFKRDWLYIDNLKADTIYFFRIIATDNSGNTASSGIYTFKTAISSDKPEIDKKSVVITAGDNVLLNAIEDFAGDNSVVLIPDLSYAFSLNLSRPEIVKSVAILVKNSMVLGINSVYGAEPNSMGVNLVELDSGKFIGHLVSPPNEGFYEVVLKVEDTNGNISEDKVGLIKVVAPLTVTDGGAEPIENAKVLFYRFDQKTKVYKLITSEAFGFQNPGYTEVNGEIRVVLPKGQYRIRASEIGYMDQEVDFNVGLGSDENLPKIRLEKTRIGLSGLVEYYGKSYRDVANFSKSYLGNLTTSGRFFKLMTIMVVITGVTMWWLFVCNRWEIYWWLLPKKVAARIINSSIKEQEGFLNGTIIDPAINKPIDKVKVYLLDDKFNKVLSKAVTDSLGEFRLAIKPAKGYRLAAVRDGFEPTPILDFTDEGINAGRVRLTMNNVLSKREKMENVLKYTFKKTGGWLVSGWLSGLTVLELIFWRNFNLSKVLPWLLIMISSLTLWLIMIFKKNEMEKS